MLNKVKVSVCVPTYNQKKYIGQCLESLVTQETDFDYEIIVADDCSTDSTCEIVQEYAENYPEIVKPIFHKKNIGALENFVFVHKQAVGEYIAHMDGDDYALPGKLQKQTDFLDKNKNCSFLCHPVQLISEDGSKILGVSPVGSQPTFSDLDRLVKKYIFFANSSKMYRASVNIFDHSDHHGLIDFFLHVEHASLGDIGFLPNILGCNRKKCGGITSATGERLYYLYEQTLAGFERARELGVSDKVVNYGKAKYLVGAAFLCLSREDVAGYKNYLILSRIDNSFFSLSHAVLYYMRGNAGLLLALYRGRQLILGLIRKLR